MARSATEAHCRKLGISPGSSISAEQLESLLGKLTGGLNIFLGRDKAAAVIADVRSALAEREGTRADREAGFPMGSLVERVAILAGVGVLAAGVAVPILQPVLAAEGPRSSVF